MIREWHDNGHVPATCAFAAKRSPFQSPRQLDEPGRSAQRKSCGNRGALSARRCLVAASGRSSLTSGLRGMAKLSFSTGCSFTAPARFAPVGLHLDARFGYDTSLRDESSDSTQAAVSFTTPRMIP